MKSEAVASRRKLPSCLIGLVVQNEEYFLLIPSHFLIPLFTSCTDFSLLCQGLDPRPAASWSSMLSQASCGDVKAEKGVGNVLFKKKEQVQREHRVGVIGKFGRSPLSFP